MIKNKTKIGIFVLTLALMISLINPVQILSVQASTSTNSKVVESELKAILKNHKNKEVIFENGISIYDDEVVSVDHIIKDEGILWISNNEDIVSVKERNIIPNKLGTTFLVGEKANKIYINEVYVSSRQKISTYEVSEAQGVKSQYVVYIDPGHGGSDPGASGYGYREKDLVLRMAFKLKDKLQSYGIRVIMSRESDVYVSLQDRSSSANNFAPDAFVSIHTNAYNGNVSGIETFYNKDKDKDLAKRIQVNLIKSTGANDRSAKYGNYHVIRETTMPASLIETGFIDNASDAPKLNDDSYQHKLMSSVADATFSYLKDNVQLTPGNKVETERVFGNTRYETSYKVFEKGWVTSENIVLASGVDYPDALCAAPLATKYNAPILLAKNEPLANQTELLNIIKTKGVKNVFIVGGTGVITSTVDSELSKLGITVKRFGGKDRYETSVLVAKEVGTPSGEVALAYGLDFADGLSISSVAAQKNMPILLTDSKNLPTSVKAFVNEYKVSKTFVVGQNYVVSDSVMGQMPNPERLGGRNRYETNEKVFYRFKDELNLEEVFITSSLQFPDALAASALAGKKKSFVVLSNNASVEPVVKSLISSNKEKMKIAYVLGSNKVITENVLIGIGL